MDEDGNTSLNAWVKLAVTNTKGFELPKTGGLGTILFTAIGAAGLALCIILFTRKRRTEDK
nr:LPXTG cell wall anchor domain-containing protein [uncultured Blautia sp.]